MILAPAISVASGLVVVLGLEWLMYRLAAFEDELNPPENQIQAAPRHYLLRPRIRQALWRITASLGFGAIFSLALATLVKAHVYHPELVSLAYPFVTLMFPLGAASVWIVLVSIARRDGRTEPISSTDSSCSSRY